MNLAEQLRARAESNDSLNAEEIKSFLTGFFTEHPQLSIEVYAVSLKGMEMKGYEKSRWEVSKPMFNQIVKLVKSEGFIWEHRTDSFGYIRLY